MNKNKIIFLIFVIISVFSMFAYIMYKNENNEYDNLLLENVLEDQNFLYNEYNLEMEKVSNIKVHITGEILNPGLYELEEGSRINDLIKLAGGETQNADLNKINLAYELSDGEKIYVPSISDENPTYIYSDAGENVLENSKNSSNTKNDKININKASSDELQKISGIGPSLAEKIINYRNSNGNFQNIEDLKNVSGIGEKKFETIKEHITLK